VSLSVLKFIAILQYWLILIQIAEILNVPKFPKTKMR